MKVHLRILSLSVLAAAALFCSCKGTGSGKSSYQTVTVSPGSLSTTVTATGTIEPINQVEVGAQVSGIISNIYVDYNTVVKQGQLMAEIDRCSKPNWSPRRLRSLPHARNTNTSRRISPVRRACGKRNSFPIPNTSRRSTITKNPSVRIPNPKRT